MSTIIVTPGQPIAEGVLLGVDGRPLSSDKYQERMTIMAHAMRTLKQQVIKARYDAAQTFVGNELHWSNADTFGPHKANSLEVRRVLRSRSRYEVIENNPFLKGTVLSVSNDFVGSGPKLQITDKRMPRTRQKQIEDSWDHWCKVRKIRRKLWRMRLAKIVDGETFAVAYRNGNGDHPVQLDFQVLEADQVSSFFAQPSKEFKEIDGVRFDDFDNPLYYHILNQHPGDAYLSPFPTQPGGNWVDARMVLHWFRQDRGWLRGIPELTTSIPLCALLRRYTLAIVKHAETAADLTAIIETMSLPGTNVWTQDGKQIIDDPFDTFPVNIGSITTLPKGYALKQLNAVPLGVQYDQFVGAVLREIVRPLLVPHNIAGGTSSDANMASAVVDADIYKGGQKAERLDCDEEIMDRMFRLWWSEASLISDLTGRSRTQRNKSGKFYSDDIFRTRPIERKWRWDKIGIDHTDPSKVAQALTMLRQDKILTDRQIQEEYFNTDYEDWQEIVKAEEDFRLTLPSVKMELIDSQKPTPPAAGASGANKGNPKAQSSKSPSSNRNRSKPKQPRKVSATRIPKPSRNGHSRIPLGFRIPT